MVTRFILPGIEDIDIQFVLNCVVIQVPGRRDVLIIEGSNDSLLHLAKAIEYKVQGDEQAKENQ
jgi:hypothetical protein